MLKARVPSWNQSILFFHRELSFGYKSSVFTNSVTLASSRPPPSGSTASMHLVIAMVWRTSCAFIHTRPFVPTAASRGKRAPSIGNKKCLGSSNLCRLELSTYWESVTDATHKREVLRLHRTMKPPFSSPNPSDLWVCASKHSSSGSMSLCARETRAYTRDPT